MSSSPIDAARRRDLIVVIVAIVLPSLVTWAYFFQAESAAAAAQVSIFGVVKAVQFALPIVWVLFVQRGAVRLRPANLRGVGLGLAFGIAVAIAGALVYQYALRDADFFAAAAGEIREKIDGWAIDRVWEYAALGVFYTACHSFLEEYYWRWFVFGQLRNLTSTQVAIVVSSLGFMAHHVLILGKYFGFDHWAAWLLSLCVAVGGAFWAWLYDKTDSLLGPWLSHLLVDAAIFLIGYQIVADTLR